MVKYVDVNEDEWNQLTALRNVAQKIVNNPAARRRLEEAQRIIDPTAPTPMLDADRAQNEPLNAIRAELSEQIKALKEERESERRDSTLRQISDRQEKAFARLKTEHRYTDEGVKAVREMMEAKGLLDVDDAVAIWERANPPPMPATPSGGVTGASWGFADVDDQSDALIKELIATKGESPSVADRMASNALNDFRAGRR